jgi:hypothetical protein
MSLTNDLHDAVVNFNNDLPRLAEKDNSEAGLLLTLDTYIAQTTARKGGRVGRHREVISGNTTALHLFTSHWLRSECLFRAPSVQDSGRGFILAKVSCRAGDCPARADLPSE